MFTNQNIILQITGDLSPKNDILALFGVNTKKVELKVRFMVLFKIT